MKKKKSQSPVNGASLQQPKSTPSSPMQSNTISSPESSGFKGGMLVVERMVHGVNREENGAVRLNVALISPTMMQHFGLVVCKHSLMRRNNYYDVIK
jgi:hypothetical protein